MSLKFQIRYNDSMNKILSISFIEEWMKKHHLPLMPVIWGITCLIIGILVLLGFLGYSRAEKNIACQFNDQQLILAQQAARGIESLLEEIAQTTLLFSRLPEFQNFIQRKNRGGLESILQKFYEGSSGKIQLLYVISSAGEVLSSYPSEPWKAKRERDLRLPPPIQFLKPGGDGKVQFIFPKDGGKETEWMRGKVALLIPSPVFRDRELLGTLGCLLDFDKISDRYVAPVRSGKTGGAWMISPEGRFVAHYEAEFVGQDAFSARRNRALNFSYERIERIMREDMIAGKAGTDIYLTGWHREKQGTLQKLIAYAPVHGAVQIGSIAVVIPYAEVTEVVWESFKSSLFLLTILALTLLGGTYVGHKINQRRILAEEKVQWGEEIVRSQTRLQALYDGAPDAITIVDSNYLISAVNKTGINWYKRPLEDFVGKPCYQEFQGRSDRCPNCPAQESFSTGQAAFRERASLVADGTKRYLQLFTFPLQDRNGRVVEVVEYVKDVTAERKLQHQVIQSERLAVVGRMSANVAHEIKNPLGTIVLNAELLQEELDRISGTDPTEAKSLLEVIKSELDRLIEVAEEYLQFARLPHVKLEKGQVNEVISDLLSFLKEDAAGRNVVLVEELEKSLPQVQLDSKQFRQALLNILKNSIEAMPQGGRLAVATAAKDGWVEIRIADSGRGIPEEDLDLVFTPFFSTKHGGTGLGLPITAHIVEEHHGALNVDSLVDAGTTFSIRLPACGSEDGSRGHSEK
jgi:signal transduction histidine kinase